MTNVAEFVERYRDTETDYWWEALDRPIFRACSDSPQHLDAKEVFGKVALINRCYRANLHMGAKNAEWNLAGAMVKGRFDDVMERLQVVAGFSRDELPRILNAHEEFVRLAHDVTKRTENSFCAKYLSFHFPKSVPIFDSFAYNVSWQLEKDHIPTGLYADNWNVDYGYHCEALLRLIDALHNEGVANPDLKRVDYILYSAGGLDPA
jgi:hypothetical protein